MNKKYTIEEVRKIFENYNCKLITNEYKDNKQPLEIIASCGHKHICKLNVFMSAKHKTCNACAIKLRAKNKKIPYEKVKEEFENRGCKLLSKEYMNKRNKLDYIASCGHKDSITFKNFENRKYNVCTKCARSGENNGMYKKEKTDEERFNDRSGEEYKEFRNAVFERDKYTCRICKDDKGGNLECHHMDSHNWCIGKRLEVSNGITLCKECHKNFHLKYGYGDNTKEQFEEWYKLVAKEIKE